MLSFSLTHSLSLLNPRLATDESSCSPVTIGEHAPMTSAEHRGLGRPAAQWCSLQRVFTAAQFAECLSSRVNLQLASVAAAEQCGLRDSTSEHATQRHNLHNNSCLDNEELASTSPCTCERGWHMSTTNAAYGSRAATRTMEAREQISGEAISRNAASEKPWSGGPARQRRRAVLTRPA